MFRKLRRKPQRDIHATQSKVVSGMLGVVPQNAGLTCLITAWTPILGHERCFRAEDYPIVNPIRYL